MVNNNDNSDESLSIGQREFKCEAIGCWYRTNRAYNLWRHERRHNGDVERKVHQCPLCLYSTNKATNLRRHIGTRHPEYDLEEAAKSSSGEKSTRMQCDFPGCKYITNRAYDMRRHMSVHSNQEKDIRRFKCSLCLYSSDRKANLARHVEVRHSEMFNPNEEVVVNEIEVYDEPELEYQMLEDLIEEVEEEPITVKQTSEPELENDQDFVETTEIVFEPVIEALNAPEANPNPVPVTKVDSSMVWQLPQLEGNLNNEVIAINVNGELRWFQAIQPPEGVSSELQRAMQIPREEPQIVQLNSENKLEEYVENLEEGEEYEVISLNKQDDDFHEEYFNDDEQEEEGEQHIYNIHMIDEFHTKHTKPSLAHSSPMGLSKQDSFVLTKKNVSSNDWTWTASSTSNPVDNTSASSDYDPNDISKDIDDEFPDWWDDGVHTKSFQNSTFRNQHQRTSSANVQSILRLIYDLYYKPFKEDRKKCEIFQIKDSWLCATRMTRMQLIKDMYSKQGT